MTDKNHEIIPVKLPELNKNPATIIPEVLDTDKLQSISEVVANTRRKLRFALLKSANPSEDRGGDGQSNPLRLSI